MAPSSFFKMYHPNLCFPCYISFFYLWPSCLPLIRTLMITMGTPRTSPHLKILFKFFFKDLLYLFIFWLCWVFVAVRGLSLVAASRGYSLLWCDGFSLRLLLLLQSMGSRRTGFSGCGTRASVVVVHGLSCSMACGIFPDQGSNPCLLHWQADS